MATEQIINIERIEYVYGLFGNFDENIRLIEREFSVTVTLRAGEIKVSGEPEGVDGAVRTINGLLSLISCGEVLTEQNIRYIMSLAADGDDKGIERLSSTDCICITAKGKPIKPKTIGLR